MKMRERQGPRKSLSTLYGKFNERNIGAKLEFGDK